MIFRHLKMTGFKSFAEPTAVEIESGLTGIVGPNGCGKSNVVEALRWVMGESNARQMRGTELDDIIFAGTQNRPARDIAEITLELDNSARRAPVDFNKSDDLEITRKVERGKGSSYYINGRPARAKDVQLLFADTATGSRSAGMVSQGRIGAIVGAKPEDRRSLLEEAANIKGLHQRRHEAELRLKNAETNLERLEDIANQLTEQRAQLAKQARQAARYRSVADRIRKAEASLFLRRWQDISQDDKQAATQLHEAKMASSQAASQAAEAEKHQLLAADALPPLLEKQAQASAEYQRLKLAIDECDKEAARIQSSIIQLAQQLQQIEADESRENSLQSDAQKALADLNKEKQTLQNQLAEQQPQLAASETKLQKAQEASLESDEAYAAAKANLSSFESAKAQHQQRLTQLQSRIKAAEAGLLSLDCDTLETDAKKAESLRQSAQTDYEKAQKTLEAAETLLAELQSSNHEKNEIARHASAELAALNAQIDALSYVLNESQSSQNPPISDLLTVTNDMEAALAACLSTDLSLPAEEDVLGYWRDDVIKAEITAPTIGTALSDFVSGHPAIERAIAGVSVIDDTSMAKKAQLSLVPGQALVSSEGELWRWDGLVRKAHDGTDERLRQKAKLDSLLETLQQTQDIAEGAEDAAAQGQNAFLEAQKEAHSAKAAQKQVESQLLSASRTADASQVAYESALTRKTDLEAALAQAKADFEDATGDLAITGDISSLQEDEAKLRLMADERRDALSEIMGSHASLREQLNSASQRIEAITAQEQAWVARLSNTDGRLSDLARRRSENAEQKLALDARPDEIMAQKQELGDLVDESEARHRQASDDVARAQAHLRDCEATLKEAQRLATQARESLIRAEGVKERSADQLESLRVRIEEQLQAAPAQLPAMAEISEDEALPALFQLEDRVARLQRERDSIGPVNLRAEAEMTEIDERLAEMQTEKDDLLGAIAKLRAAIATLNKEGRARLLDSFQEVNKYFKELFTTLFGGGQAELRLTESPDPLEAGLEILASPPGKKLQSLSLLSGGEQALTALAIIFAVFLTNPAPICVLDEVDAPLDDSNVSRFCDLLRDIVMRTKTRFLIVTHHRMTMARMDRLYGVTMEQKGISRLVSVDLQTAETFEEAV
ncbi:MAG: chromosome segregation SMC family protein [Candidatus Puniceispirillaceae bacterium]